MVTNESITLLAKEKQKLVARIGRIRGQVAAIERSLSAEDDSADVLMLLANVRGGINSLMAEVLEDHIRLHMISPKKDSQVSDELAEGLIDLVRAYGNERYRMAKQLYGCDRACSIVTRNGDARKMTHLYAACARLANEWVEAVEKRAALDHSIADVARIMVTQHARPESRVCLRVQNEVLLLRSNEQ